jgi:hypothetical protein
LLNRNIKTVRIHPEATTSATGRTYGKLCRNEGSQGSVVPKWYMFLKAPAWCSDLAILTSTFGSTGSIAWKIIPPRHNFPEQPGIIPRRQARACAAVSKTIMPFPGFARVEGNGILATHISNQDTAVLLHYP